jgi:hypothetical protein
MQNAEFKDVDSFLAHLRQTRGDRFHDLVLMLSKFVALGGAVVHCVKTSTSPHASRLEDRMQSVFADAMDLLHAFSGLPTDADDVAQYQVVLMALLSKDARRESGTLVLH